MPPRPLPIFIDAQAVRANILDWAEISRDDALRLESRGAPVVVTHGPEGHAQRFDDQSPFWHTYGPYDYTALRYFVYRSGVVAKSRPSASALPRPAAKAAAPAIEVEPELIPLEEEEVEEKPVKRAAATPQASAKPKETEKKELRFDLALDPATPGLEDDVFVLTSGDGTYNMSKTIKDDKVPGDMKITLIFPGVKEGKTYTLSQVQDGEEAVLVPEVTYGAPKSGPGEVIGCKAVFRECRIIGETFDLTKPEDPRFPFQLAFAKEKWVYVFGGPSGKPVNLLAEGRGTGDGGFFPVDLKKHGGKNLRPYIAKASPWITLPLMVNGKEWDLYACLSPIQLPWKRIGMIEKKPQPRCYRIGDPTGGACWVPGHIGREVPKLSKARDSRIADPGKDIVMIGLVDYMAEAKRRAGIYQRELKPYLENRFDTSLENISTSEGQMAKRRKKHLAGLIKVFLESNSQKKKFAECLALDGAQLDQFLRDENERELKLKRRFSASAKALVKWMDSPDKFFEEVLVDYMSDPEMQDLWEIVEKEIAFLTSYFEVSSLTRLFGKRMVMRQDSWVNLWLLNPDRFPAVRKTSQFSVEVMNWLSKVIHQSNFLLVQRLTSLYSAWIPDSQGRLRPVTLHSKETTEVQTKRTIWFPNESQQIPDPKKKVWLSTLSKPGIRKQTSIFQISFNKSSMEKLGLITDSKIFEGLVMGLEVNNIYLALTEWNRNRTGAEAFNLFGSVLDGLGAILETAANHGAKIGRGVLGVWAGVCAFCDFYSALVSAEKAAEDGDYDKVAAQLGIAVGSASMAVGAALVATSVFSGMAIGQSVMTAGLGVSMIGAGSVPGAMLLLIGAGLVAAFSIRSAMLVDEDMELWLSECPFGKTPSWQPKDRTAPGQIAILFEMLHPVQFEIRHEYLNGPGRYVLALSGPFNEFTKISIHSLELLDSKMRSSTVLKDEVLRESAGNGYEIRVEPGQISTVLLGISDEICWNAHKSKNPDFDNRFKYIRLNARIDVYDDREIWLPSRAVKRPMFLSIS